MKHSHAIIERHANSRPCAFTQNGSQGLQQDFNISPFDIARYRLRKNCIECSPVTFIHLRTLCCAHPYENDRSTSPLSESEVNEYKQQTRVCLVKNAFCSSGGHGGAAPAFLSSRLPSCISRLAYIDLPRCMSQ